MNRYRKSKDFKRNSNTRNDQFRKWCVCRHHHRIVSPIPVYSMQAQFGRFQYLNTWFFKIHTMYAYACEHIEAHKMLKFKILRRRRKKITWILLLTHGLCIESLSWMSVCVCCVLCTCKCIYGVTFRPNKIEREWNTALGTNGSERGRETKGRKRCALGATKKQARNEHQKDRDRQIVNTNDP